MPNPLLDAPHWLFDPEHYQAKYPGLTGDTLAEAGFADHYDHFLKYGDVEGRSPHPLFDPARYVASLAPDQAASCVAIGAFRHFLQNAWNNQAEPQTSPDFDPAWYRATYPAVVDEIRAGKWHSALHHYLLHKDRGSFQALPPIAPPPVIKIHIDRPVLRDGAAVEALETSLDIIGWAAANHPIDHVDVLIDTTFCGRAQYGLSTPGVPTRFPELTHGQSAGYRYLGPPPHSPGNHQVSVVAHSALGVIATASFSVSVRATPTQPARRRMRFSERVFKLDLLRNAGEMVEFVVVLYGPADPDNETTRRTLAALQRQVYPNWRTPGIAPPGEAWLVQLAPGEEPGVDALLELALHRLVAPDADFIFANAGCGEIIAGRPWAASPGLAERARISVADLRLMDPNHLTMRLAEHAARPAHVDLVLCDTVMSHPPAKNPGFAFQAREAAVQAPEPVEFVFPARPLAQKETIRSILAIKLDHIGDFLLSLPAMRRLKEQFPAARLTVLAAPASCALANLEPAIDEVISYAYFHPRSEKGLQRQENSLMQELRERLRAGNFDLAVDLRCQEDTRHFLQESGAIWLAGFDPAYEFPWLDIVGIMEPDTQHRKRTHMIDTLADFVGKVGASFDSSWQARGISGVWLDPVASQGAPDNDRLRIGIHPGKGNAMRQWPAEHFATLITWLAERYACRIILVGSADEADLAAHLMAKLGRIDSVISCVGLTDPQALARLIAGCDLFIGNDSGPHHLAASLGVPTIGIHSGVVDAREWGPVGPSAVALRRQMVCSPCYIGRIADCPRDVACLRDLPPESVMEMVQKILAGRHQPLQGEKVLLF